MTAGMACGTVGLLVLTQLEADSGYGLLLAGYLLFGIALGLVYAPMSTAAMAAMPAEKVGIASGVLAMDRVMAGTIALAACGAVFHALQDGGSSFTAGIAGSTWVVVALCALGTVLTWALRARSRAARARPLRGGQTAATGPAAPLSPSPLPSLKAKFEPPQFSTHQVENLMRFAPGTQTPGLMALGDRIP